MINMIPTIDGYELEKAVNLQFGTNIELFPLLFGENYSDGIYKSFDFSKEEKFYGYRWENEEDIRLRNLVRAYLKDILPNHNEVLINIYW